MPKVNLARLKAGGVSRGKTPQSQASISRFFNPQRTEIDGNDNVKSSIKRVANESAQNQQQTKRQKLSLPKSPVPKDTDDIELSSTTLTKLKHFEKGSKYFTTNDTIAETNIDKVEVKNDKTFEDQDDCITIDDKMESSTNNINIDSYSRKKSESFSSNKQSKVKSPVSISEKASKTKNQYTPLELQFLDIKTKYSDTVLLVECGYKYRFFGEDAEIAARELNIMCHMDHNFMSASIPTHRLHVHVKRLVSKGYKVGVVKQTETAALKAVGDNKSTVFTRELSALYTKSTLIGEDMKNSSDDDSDSENNSTDASGVYLMCLCESSQTGNNSYLSLTETIKEKTTVYGFLAVQPSTGDMIFDEFLDTPTCSELETRLQHIGVAELLIPESLSQHSKNFLKVFNSQFVRPEDSMRLEQIPTEHFSHETALKVISNFTKEVNVKTSDQDSSENDLLQRIMALPQGAQTCYAVLVKYLKDFKLERILRLSSNFIRFSSKSECMILGGLTVKNLELFRNEQGSHHNTLFSILNHTRTNFGKRLLKKWISHPLMDPREINSRLDSVSEILSSNASCLRKIGDLLTKLPDLERGLCSVYSKKCSTSEFLTILKSLINVFDVVTAANHEAVNELSSSLLLKTFTEVPQLLKGTDKFIHMIDEQAARMGDKTKLFVDQAQFPKIEKCALEIKEILDTLKSHRKSVRQVLQHPSIDFCTIAGNEFLIEVRNAKLGSVPSDWIKINSTKQACRFRTPFVEEKYRLLCQQREIMARTCDEAWIDYLEMFIRRFTQYRKATQLLAVVDCLFSMATVAKQPGYTRPVLKDSTEAELQISEGRHPILDSLLSETEQYVPNDTNLQGSGTRCMIITGPNMGGKSCYIKQVALIAIMAQIGSYVPASHVILTPLDAIHTRMGASDNIYKGQSTFMVELQEAAHILDQSTSRSLVILDELGRGTSTHDGIAVAYATLYYVISKIKSLSLFVTHYPNIAEIEKTFQKHVTNNHMAFMTSNFSGCQSSADEKDVGNPSNSPVTFLYRLVQGVAERSYGLNVARLAGIPKDVLEIAAEKSHELEIEITMRRRTNRQFRKIWHSKEDGNELRDFISHANRGTQELVLESEESRITIS